MCSARELQSVVVGPDVREGGLRVTAVELYGDGTIVRWHFVPAGRGIEVDFRLDLEDDVGTRYRRQAGGPWDRVFTLGDVASVTGHTTFVPATPVQARSLTISGSLARFEVRLRGDPA